MAGINPANILAHEKILISQYLTDAVKFVYEYYPWPLLITTEIRQFRPEWKYELYDGTPPVNGDEYYINGKYYRLWNESAQSASLTPDDEENGGLAWHEIGDNYPDDPFWSEKGTYKVGARVREKGHYETKTYVCTAELSGNPSGITAVNFEYDGIDLSNTAHWKQIDTSFNRYLPWDGFGGQDSISTVISVHSLDPRKKASPPLNWKEGVEGLYIQGDSVLPNNLWVTYRPEPPEFDELSAEEQILSALAPAIKTYAYKCWLIGEGQHEKAALQEETVMFLLVKEIDKLNSQQDRATPYSISSEPYRKVSAGLTYTIEETPHRIGQIKEGNANSNVRFDIKSFGRNAARKRNALIKSAFTTRATGGNKVKKGKVYEHSETRFWSRVNAKNALKQAEADSAFKLFTGTPYRAIAIGYVSGEKFKVGRPTGTISLTAVAQGSRDLERNASAVMSLSTDLDAKNVIKNASIVGQVDFTMQVEPIRIKVHSRTTNMQATLTATATDINWQGDHVWETIAREWNKS